MGRGLRVIDEYSAALICAAEPTECKATRSTGVITQEGYEWYVFFAGITRMFIKGGKADRASNDPGSGSLDNRRDLVADVEFLDDVLYVIVHGPFAKAEDLRDFISGLADGGQFQHLQFS